MNYPGRSFRKSIDDSITRSDRILQRDPHDVTAHLKLAEAYIDLWCYGFLSRDNALPKVKSAITRARELDDGLGTVHTIQGILLLSEWDWVGSEQEFQTGIRLDPNQFMLHHWLALYLAAMGRHEEALSVSEQALVLAPFSGYQVGFASILYFAQNFVGMVEVLEEAIKKNPNCAPDYDWLGMAYVQLKKYDKAIEVYKKAVTLSDGLAEIKAGLGHAYGLAGRKAEARAVLDELVSLTKKYYIPPVQIAFVCLGLGEADLTFEWLEKAFRQRSWEMVFIREEPWFDDLRSDTRFLNIIERMKFPVKPCA